MSETHTRLGTSSQVVVPMAVIRFCVLKIRAVAFILFHLFQLKPLAKRRCKENEKTRKKTSSIMVTTPELLVELRSSNPHQLFADCQRPKAKIPSTCGLIRVSLFDWGSTVDHRMCRILGSWMSCKHAMVQVHQAREHNS